MPEIAAEKAGIIKPGVPVVTATDGPEALTVIGKIAREKNAPLTIITANDVASRLAGTSTPSLLGDHQKLNAALAQATVEVLQRQIPVSAGNVRAGLAAVNWPGRLQLIRKANGQIILLDGAHNADGANVLRAALEKYFSARRPVFIFGALADKNWLAICRTLAPLAAKIFTVPVASGRTADARELAAAFCSANPAAEVAALEGLVTAINACKNEPFIVITGSLYLIGEALEQLGLSPANINERGLNEWKAAPDLR